MNLPCLSTFICCALWAGIDSAKITDKGISSSDKDVILKKHNTARTEIEEGKFPNMKQGKNFKTLKYDEKLEKEAQKISDTCIFEHVEVNDDRWSVGQNLFIHYTSGSVKKGEANWKEATNTWLEEAEYYTHGGPINSENGHFTQMIWADTEYIGCGYTVCNEKNVRMPYFQLYVCNYGPAGNYQGEDPYELA